MHWQNSQPLTHLQEMFNVEKTSLQNICQYIPQISKFIL